jgi:hypothetical protein
VTRSALAPAWAQTAPGGYGMHLNIMLLRWTEARLVRPGTSLGGFAGPLLEMLVWESKSLTVNVGRLGDQA